MVWSFSSILHGVCQLLIISNNSATNIALPPPRATPGQQPLRVDALRQSRLFWDQTPNDLVGHHLFKRDACTQAFGAGWSGTTCLPGSTYCCLNANSNYPQCQEYLGLGWCCTVYEGGCYVDLQTSSCGQPGAVSCTELAAGTSEACCPQHTICAPGYNASNTFVRCDINQTALIALASSSTSLSGAVSPTASASSAVVQFSSTTTSASTLSTTSFASSAPTTTTSSASPTTTSSALSHTTGLTATLTAGAIAGIAIGPVAAVLLIVGGGWWAWRKRFRSPQGGTTASNFPADPKPSVLYSSYPNINPVYPPEISGDTIKQEMPSHPISGSTGSPAELESNALHQRFK